MQKNPVKILKSQDTCAILINKTWRQKACRKVYLPAGAEGSQHSIIFRPLPPAGSRHKLRVRTRLPEFPRWFLSDACGMMRKTTSRMPAAEEAL